MNPKCPKAEVCLLETPRTNRQERDSIFSSLNSLLSSMTQIVFFPVVILGTSIYTWNWENWCGQQKVTIVKSLEFDLLRGFFSIKCYHHLLSFFSASSFRVVLWQHPKWVMSKLSPNGRFIDLTKRTVDFLSSFVEIGAQKRTWFMPFLTVLLECQQFCLIKNFSKHLNCQYATEFERCLTHSSFDLSRAHFHTTRVLEKLLTKLVQVMPNSHSIYCTLCWNLWYWDAN